MRQLLLQCCVVILFLPSYVLARIFDDTSRQRSDAFGLSLVQRRASAENAKLGVERPGAQTFAFVHIPKNAGTAIENAGRSAHVDWTIHHDRFNERISMPDTSKCVKHHVPPFMLKAIGDKDSQLFENRETFCVTRHPYDRVVSEYLYMLTVPWGESMSRMYDTGLLDHPRCSSAGLNAFLQRALAKVKAGRRFVHDCHFLAQSDYIWGGDGFLWCKHVLRMDELPNAFNRMMEASGQRVRLPWRRANNSTQTCPGMSREDLTLETKRLVDEAYEADFTKLNYTMDAKPVKILRIPHSVSDAVVELATRTRTRFLEKSTSRSTKSMCHAGVPPPSTVGSEFKLRLQNADVFCLVQHPYKRATAFYKYILGKQFTPGRDNGTRFRTSFGPPCAAATMNRFLQLSLQSFKAGSKSSLACHMTPQTEYIWRPGGARWCDTVLHAEDLPGNFNSFMSKKGYPDVTLHNVSAFADSPPAPQVCDRELGSKDLDTRTRLLLRTVYREDMTRLGYRAW
jgi:hypothetical protein